MVEIAFGVRDFPEKAGLHLMSTKVDRLGHVDAIEFFPLLSQNRGGYINNAIIFLGGFRFLLALEPMLGPIMVGGDWKDFSDSPELNTLHHPLGMDVKQGKYPSVRINIKWV